MYEILDAHYLTIIIIAGSVMVTPFYVFATYVFSNASARKGAITGGAFLVWGAIMFWVCLSGLPREMGVPGNFIVPVCWILPSVLLYYWRDWFLERPLSQRWLIGLQLFRGIGAVFLIEMFRGNIPGIFAYPAGIGDIFVAFVALAVLFKYKRNIPNYAVYIVIFVGIADFLSAFFFGFTSSETPFQVFYPEVPNNVIYFPTGMIPLFLVPYAIFFHTLSLLNSIKFKTEQNINV